MHFLQKNPTFQENRTLLEPLLQRQTHLCMSLRALWNLWWQKLIGDLKSKEEDSNRFIPATFVEKKDKVWICNITLNQTTLKESPCPVAFAKKYTGQEVHCKITKEMGIRKNSFKEILVCGYCIISGRETLYRNIGAKSTKTKLVPLGSKWFEMLHVWKKWF